MSKRFIAVMLSLAIVFLISLTAYAAETEEETVSLLRYSHISGINGDFSINNGTANCFGSGQSRDSSSITVVKVTLQRRATGSTAWSYVCSWSDTQNGRVTAYVDETKSVSKGYDYRIYVKCTIKDSNGTALETSGLYSRIVSYK